MSLLSSRLVSGFWKLKGPNRITGDLLIAQVLVSKFLDRLELTLYPETYLIMELMKLMERSVLAHLHAQVLVLAPGYVVAPISLVVVNMCWDWWRRGLVQSQLEGLRLLQLRDFSGSVGASPQ